jgi:formylglycine-generating enzyme required for sulfatase activity
MKRLASGICVLCCMLAMACVALDGGSLAGKAAAPKGPASPAATSAPKASSPATPAASPAGKELTLDLGGSATMKLILINPGKFMMGGKGQHEVTLTKPFYLGATLVTQAQYEAIMGNNPSRFKGPTNPVETVLWDDASNFCKKLSAKTRQNVHLPSEAEWEYACRAGTKTLFSFGDDESQLGDYGWYLGNSGGTTHPVAQKKPNPWGLYDMHGNVWEWCADVHGDYPTQPVTDPQGAGSGPYRIVRGGCYLYGPVQCRSANRGFYAPVDRDIVCGLRVAASVSAP